MFFFESFLFFDQKWQNPRENQKTHTKNTKIRRLYEARHFPQICVYCFFLFFFGFLEVFATFGQKPKKTRENQKKRKKNEKTKD